MTPLDALDYAGVAVFAATGALAASRKQLDHDRLWSFSPL
jgi:uncharacterized membrane protein YeiH